MRSGVTGGRDVKGALAHYETERRLEVEKTQHSADVSLVWFEHVRRFWDMDPTRFAFGLMTRAKAITYDNLALRAPEFVEEIDRLVAQDVRNQGFDVDVAKPVVPMFQPFRLRGMTLNNRVVVSPMDQYSAVDGMPTDWHLVHLGSRATGGAGLVFTEMVCVSADARITLGCTGLYDDAQEAAYKRIVDFVHANSAAKFCLQLGHAGRKGATKLMWEGMDQPLAEGALADHLGLADSVLSAQPGAARNDPRRHGQGRGGLRASRRARPTRRLRHARTALRARLSAGELHLAAHEQAHRRIRRLIGEPPALPARSFPRAAQGVAGRKADVGAHLGDRLGGGRPDRRRCGRGRARLRRSRLRPDRRVDRADHARRRADLRPHVPDAVLRPDPQRGGARHHVRRRDHQSPIRSTPSWRRAAPISSRLRARIWSIRSSP